MSTTDADDFDPESPRESEIGREMVDQSTGLGSVMAHLYRGEMDRVTMWRQRLDASTKWAVTVIAGILAYGFSQSGTSHAVLLAGIVVTTMFLGIEARRYQHFDVFRSRARVLEENLFANALDPSAGVERRDWRRELSEDYRHPATKIRYREALQRRLRRIYFPLLVLLLAAWLVRITVLSPGADVDATLGSIPEFVVIGTIGGFYIAALVITFYPQTRQAKGEFDETDHGKWKQNEEAKKKGNETKTD